MTLQENLNLVEQWKHSILNDKFSHFSMVLGSFLLLPTKNSRHTRVVSVINSQYAKKLSILMSTLAYPVLHWAPYQYCFLTGCFRSTSFSISHFLTAIIQCLSQGPYSEPFQTSKMEHFVKIVDDFWPLTVYEKWFILDVWQGSE